MSDYSDKLKDPRRPSINRRIHSIPIGDLEIHCAQATCWCHPFELEPGIFAHNAKDCREAAERQTGQGCSEGWINIAEVVPPS